MQLTNSIDLSSYTDATVVLERFVDRAVDQDEGLYVAISNNGGTTWKQIFAWTENSKDDDRIWHNESYDLATNYLTSNFTIKFTAKTTAAGEEIQLDNFRVITTNNVTSPPSSPVLTPTQITDLTYSLNAMHTSAKLSWTPTNGNFITNYNLETIVPSATQWSTINAFYGNATSNNYNHNVTQGLEYSFRVTPRNSHGLGPISNIVNFVVPDIQNPVITLTGDSTIRHLLNTPFVDPGFSVTDNIDALMTNDVIVTGSVDSSRIGKYSLHYFVSDGAGNFDSKTRIVNVVQFSDTIAPVIIPPRDITVEATGSRTVLSIGNAIATDNSGTVTITNNATFSYPLGNTVILWTATDGVGNSASVTQTINVRDTTAPSIPKIILLNATGVLTWINISDYVTDIVDASPTVTSNTSSYLPIGNTMVTWNATDSSGNWATATLPVIVSKDDLDSDWHYVLRWHEGYWGHAAIVVTKTFYNLSINPSDVGQGNAYLFKTFNTDDIRNHNITIKSDESSLHNVTISILDGAYSKHTPSDFTLSGGPTLKGGGILTSYTLTDMPESFEPDWTRSQLNETTLVISLEKKVSHYSPFQLNSVEFDDYSKWVFGDYKVEQRGNKGTYLLLPTRSSVYGLPVNDTFTGSLDGWTYWGGTSDYVFKQDHLTGNPLPSAFVNMDQFGVFSGMSKIIDISNVQDGQNLTLSYNYRASSIANYGTVTNSYLYVFDADTGERLLFGDPAAGGTYDTGWMSYSTDLTDETSDSDRIEIVLGLYDSWIANWNQTNWYDNVVINAVNLSDFSLGTASRQAGEANTDDTDKRRVPPTANMTHGAPDPNNWFERLP